MVFYEVCVTGWSKNNGHYNEQQQCGVVADSEEEAARKLGLVPIPKHHSSQWQQYQLPEYIAHHYVVRNFEYLVLRLRSVACLSEDRGMGEFFGNQLR